MNKSKYNDAFEQRFVLEYLKDLNATQAAIRAGCTVASANTTGMRLLQREDVQQAIEKANAERNETVKIDAALVLRELMALATVDISAAFNEDGSLKPIHDIPLEVRKAIAGVDVFEEFEGRGENRVHIGNTRKVKFWDRTKALEMLGRHIQLFKDSLALTGADGGPVQVEDNTRASRLAALLALATQRRDTGEDLV